MKARAEYAAKLKATVLNIHGIQQNCNRNVLYTSKEYDGLHIYDMYHLQGVSKMQFLFRHVRSNDMTGKLMQTSIRYTQLETGLSRPYYSYNYYKAFFSSHAYMAYQLVAVLH